MLDTPVLPPAEKLCSKCGETKTLSEFHKEKAKKLGVRNQCKTCNSEATKSYRRRYPLCRVVNASRAHARKKGGEPLNVTRAELEQLLKEHNGTCDFTHCNEPATCTDHCHETGSFRGRLCRRHNRALGFLNDSIQELQDALAYLKEKTLTL
jgi:hypothetical protein